MGTHIPHSIMNYCIKESTWVWDDPVYVSFDDGLLEEFGITNPIVELNHKDLASNSLRGGPKSIFLFQSENKVIMARLTYYLGGLDGSGVFYHFSKI